jgi:hypothetical protein
MRDRVIHCFPFLVYLSSRRSLSFLIVQLAPSSSLIFSTSLFGLTDTVSYSLRQAARNVRRGGFSYQYRGGFSASHDGRILIEQNQIWSPGVNLVYSLLSINGNRDFETLALKPS